MTRALKRWIALILLGALAFSQASIALAACAMDRGSMAQTMPTDSPCNGGASDPQLSVSAACVAHCTADLQLIGFPAAIVRSAADTPVLFVPSFRPPGSATLREPEAPPPALSRRVLLHSYLI